ncbi:hypothetical protein M0804_006870 [Polistes exclamans]|nr:hypothetical protein M0804_006870 [Polistes exclamans]
MLMVVGLCSLAADTRGGGCRRSDGSRGGGDEDGGGEDIGNSGGGNDDNDTDEELDVQIYYEKVANVKGMQYQQLIRDDKRILTIPETYFIHAK